MRQFKFSGIVSEALLPTVLALLVKEVGSIKIDEVENSTGEIQAPRVRKVPSCANASEHRTGRMVLDFLASGPKQLKDIAAHLADNKFAASSASPTTSALIRSGHVCRTSTGVYELVKHN